MRTIDQTLARLSKSKYRSGFHLTQKEKEYFAEKGEDEIRIHAQVFVKKKLAPAYPENDGKQTPMHGHPVFKAMHATACCCRECMHHWYQVPLGKELSALQQKRIVNLLMAWLEGEMAADESNKEPEKSYDSEGYDKFGFDRDGYDRKGRNLAGFDRAGFDKNGYDRNGFNRFGYDVNGYDRHGFDKNGYNIYGYDRAGYDKAGNNRHGNRKPVKKPEKKETPPEEIAAEPAEEMAGSHTLKEDCILKGGPSCRGNCEKCSSFKRSAV